MSNTDNSHFCDECGEYYVNEIKPYAADPELKMKDNTIWLCGRCHDMYLDESYETEQKEEM